MHRQSTLKQRMILCLAAFFVALATQIVLSFYQSGTVLRELDDQMGNFNAISRFQNGVERSLTALAHSGRHWHRQRGAVSALQRRLHHL